MSNKKTRVGLGLLLGRGLSLQLHDYNARRNKINEGEENEQWTEGEGVDREGAKVEGFCCFKGGRVIVLQIFGKQGRCGMALVDR